MFISGPEVGFIPFEFGNFGFGSVRFEFNWFLCWEFAHICVELFCCVFGFRFHVFGLGLDLDLGLVSVSVFGFGFGFELVRIGLSDESERVRPSEWSFVRSCN